MIFLKRAEVSHDELCVVQSYDEVLPISSLAQKANVRTRNLFIALLHGHLLVTLEVNVFEDENALVAEDDHVVVRLDEYVTDVSLALNHSDPVLQIEGPDGYDAPIGRATHQVLVIEQSKCRYCMIMVLQRELQLQWTC